MPGFGPRIHVFFPADFEIKARMRMSDATSAFGA